MIILYKFQDMYLHLFEWHTLLNKKASLIIIVKL
jgi:hypothetical protein